MNLSYITSKRTDGANPFKIFESLAHIDSEVLSQALRKLDYHDFLKTSYWFGVSQTAKARAGMRCQVCNSAQQITVHHRTYETHGREHEHMNDLVVLCDLCHSMFHGHQIKPNVSVVRKSPKREKGRRVVPYTESDVTIPDGDPIILTDDLISACRANGSFTNATLRAFGMNRMLMSSGWVYRLRGKPISRENYRLARIGRFHYHTGPLE